MTKEEKPILGWAWDDGKDEPTPITELPNFREMKRYIDEAMVGKLNEEDCAERKRKKQDVPQEMTKVWFDNYNYGAGPIILSFTNEIKRLDKKIEDHFVIFSEADTRLEEQIKELQEKIKELQENNKNK